MYFFPALAGLCVSNAQQRREGVDMIEVLSNKYQFNFSSFPNGESKLLLTGGVEVLHYLERMAQLRSRYRFQGEPDAIVVWGYESDSELFKVAQAKELLQNTGHRTVYLICPYVPYSRHDRRFDGEPLSLSIFANMLNAINFERVYTWDNHSDVSSVLIKNHYPTDQNTLAARVIRDMGIDMAGDRMVVVAPDAGALKKANKLAKEFSIPLCHMHKIRSTVDGAISKSVLYSDGVDLKGKCVLVVDDLAEYGRSFKNAAIEAKKEGAAFVFLIVTHGYFGEGFASLHEAGFDCIITISNMNPKNGNFLETLSFEKND